MLPGKSSFIRGGSYWLPDAYGSAIVFNRLLGTNLTAAEAGNGLRLQPEDVSGSDAYAAEVDTRYSIEAKAVERAGDAPIVTIKYPRTAERAAKKLQMVLNAAGYKVRYICRIDAADCAHEQIQQCSVRADDQLTADMRKAVPALADWPICLNLDPSTQQDFTLIVSPMLADSLLKQLTDMHNSEETSSPAKNQT
jgi:hypothetical protein